MPARFTKPVFARCSGTRVYHRKVLGVLEKVYNNGYRAGYPSTRNSLVIATLTKVA